MEDEYPDKINLDELYTRKRELEQNKLKIYKRILNRAHKQIKTALITVITGQDGSYLD